MRGPAQPPEIVNISDNEEENSIQPNPAQSRSTTHGISLTRRLNQPREPRDFVYHIQDLKIMMNDALTRVETNQEWHIPRMLQAIRAHIARIIEALQEMEEDIHPLNSPENTD